MQAGFAGRLVLIGKYARSGVMTVRFEDVAVLVYFLDGTVVFAEADSLGETLGRVLLRKRLLGTEQYATVIRRMTEAPVGSEQMRFGEVAVALGFLTSEQVADTLALQVRERVLRCFQWVSPTCTFSATPEALDEVAHFPQDLEPLLLEGIRKYFDQERTDGVLGSIGGYYPTLAEGADQVAKRFALKPSEAQFIAGIDGRCTLAKVMADGNLDPLHAAQVLTALVLGDGLVLNDDRQVDSMQMRAANVATVAVPLPPKRPAAPPPVANVVAPVEPKISVRARPRIPRRAEPAVHRSPARSAKPSVPPPAGVKRTRLSAETFFQRGRAALAADLPGRAIRDLRRAHDLHPQAVEYELYAVWCELLLTKDRAKLPGLRDTLEQLVSRAVAEDSQMSFAHYVQAHLELQAGHERAALKCFRVAHRLDPANRDAERHCRVLRQRLAPD